jgi:glycosyltransferase involved in cell wall biosynthesis
MTVVEALARLKAAGREFRCVMTSDGMLLDALKARARELGLEDWMTYTGELPRDRLPELFRQQDIYISASLSDGTSSALLEGMASGLFPVVSRITANLPWIEHEKTGLFFEPRRADELAKMLVRAMDDDELRRRAFDANRRRVEQDGDIRRNMERYVEIVDRVVAEAGRNSGRG